MVGEVPEKPDKLEKPGFFGKPSFFWVLDRDENGYSSSVRSRFQLKLREIEIQK
ncbi:hypothetical protein NJ959_01695 [Symplocastrum sp. BBK-W-15]|uniref:Uncharacterized protein n=2 Tax=Limnofasciculus TaxID=3064905 RepID=A0AAE3KL19_9CYAN|nr:hypothetical protein [Limnofasciculus baicalensis BBK-W-15]